MKNSNSLSLSWEDNEKSPLAGHFYNHDDISLSEDDRHIYVEAAVPGILPEEIEIHFDQGILCIKADRKEETKDKDLKYYRKTSRHFFYQIPIPSKVNENQEPEAVCKDGMLKIRFSKLEEMPKKKISVKKG